MNNMQKTIDLITQVHTSLEGTSLKVSLAMDSYSKPDQVQVNKKWMKGSDFRAKGIRAIEELV